MNQPPAPRTSRKLGRATAGICVVVLGVPAPSSAEPATATASAAQRTKAPASVRVEFGLMARQARFIPGSRPGTGQLVLDGVAPRMAMMAVAPRRESTIVHSSLLSSNWQRIFSGRGGRTNAFLSGTVDGVARMHAVHVRLLRERTSASRMVFSVTPLEHKGHRRTPLGRSRWTLDAPTVTVDPVITDAIKALWASLAAFFAGDPAPPIPDNPTAMGRGGSFAWNNADGTYRGPDSADVSTEANWRRVQEANLEAAGATGFDLTDTRPDVDFRGTTVDGAALFGHDFGFVEFRAPQDATASVRNLAIWNADVAQLNISNAEVGGANLRAVDFDAVVVENSAFDRVDLTGSRLGTGTSQSSVRNAVFTNVTTTRELTQSDGRRDIATARGAFLQTDSVAFESVSFQDVDFRGAEMSETTFEGCGFQRVNFSGATIVGEGERTVAENGVAFGVLDRSFENSILEDVSFDRAQLTNVSFAGVDFSGGVSMNGAVLSNVDFTGATGLQAVDWSTVRLEGPVYGLERVSGLIGDIGDRANLRTFSNDGVLPALDPETGFDREHGTGYLVDPGTGIRLERDGAGGPLVPIDPRTGEPMRDPRSGAEIRWEGGELFDPTTREPVEVDYRSGIPEFK